MNVYSVRLRVIGRDKWADTSSAPIYDGAHFINVAAEDFDTAIEFARKEATLRSLDIADRAGLGYRRSVSDSAPLAPLKYRDFAAVVLSCNLSESDVLVAKNLGEKH